MDKKRRDFLIGLLFEGKNYRKDNQKCHLYPYILKFYIKDLHIQHLRNKLRKK